MIRLLEKLSIQKRLWLNLLISVTFLLAVAYSARLALIEVRGSADTLAKIQKSQTEKISEFQTHFTNTLQKMNDYILTLDDKTGQEFNQKIDELKVLNQSLKEAGSEAQDNHFSVEMETLLTNVKKAANSSVFLKHQIQETLIYGIEPSTTKIATSVKSLLLIEGLGLEIKSLLKESLQRLNASQFALLKMISVNDPSFKAAFDAEGLGDSADELFEKLGEHFESDYENQEPYSELIGRAHV